MKKTSFWATALLLLLCGACRKEFVSPSIQQEGFTLYTIPQGQHFCTGNSSKAVETGVLKFLVRFDSSAVYRSANPENQYDINKLFGFSDNGEHHQQYSARFGWRWSDGALRLFAYTYNQGQRAEAELGTVAIGVPAACAIAVEGDRYRFSLNGTSVLLPRLSATAVAKGYRLYPYFGGNETAPHEVRIWIKEE